MTPKPLKDYTLTEIREECKKHGDCNECPFNGDRAYTYHKCILSVAPNKWKLEKEV